MRLVRNITLRKYEKRTNKKTVLIAAGLQSKAYGRFPNPPFLGGCVFPVCLFLFVCLFAFSGFKNKANDVICLFINENLRQDVMYIILKQFLIF